MAKKLTFIISAILLLVATALPGQAGALSVTPAIRELTLTAGQNTTTTIQLENDGLKAIQLTTKIVNFTAKNQTGEPEYQLKTNPTGAALWFDVTPGPINIEAGQKAEVLVTVKTPAAANPGGFYAGVLFNFSEKSDVAKAGEVAIESTVAVPFLLTVKGNYIETGSITVFKTSDGLNRYSDGPIGFAVSYQNTGEVHLKPVGTITIKNMFGKTIKTIRVNEEQGAVLPGTIRSFTVPDWTDVGTKLGLYTATLTLSAGTVENTAQISFWLISTTWLLILAAIIVVLIVVLILVNRRSAKVATPKNP